MVAPSGKGGERAMEMAMEMADKIGGEKPVDYINTHGTSTPVGDTMELQAIKSRFGASSGRPTSHAPRGCLPLRPTSHAPRAWLLASDANLARPARVLLASDANLDHEAWLDDERAAAEGHMPHSKPDFMAEHLDYQPYVGSTKSLTGHALGAAGVHEAIYSLLMLNNDFLAESANLDNGASAGSRTPAVLCSRQGLERRPFAARTAVAALLNGRRSTPAVDSRGGGG